MATSMAEATNDIIYPPTEEHIPRECENCLIISYDLETTGLSSEDEIIQIGAHTNIPVSQRTSDFSQFILPATRCVEPEASAKIGLQVREDGLYDSRKNTIVPTVSESEGLILFLSWLRSLQDGYDGVILVSHGAIFLDIPVLIRALQRTSMTQIFFQVVKGFCDSNAIFQDDRTRRYSSYSLQSLYQTIVGTREEIHRADEDARDLHTLLLRYFNVESLSLAIPVLNSYTYTSRCMELYSAWKTYEDGKIDDMRAIVDWNKQSEKRKRAILKNLIAAGCDIQGLSDEYARSPSQSAFKMQLKRRIQSMKDTYENYLLGTRLVSAGEVVSIVARFVRRRQEHLC